jgi:hypothetical protein
MELKRHMEDYRAGGWLFIAVINARVVASVNCLGGRKEALLRFFTDNLTVVLLYERIPLLVFVVIQQNFGPPHSQTDHNQGAKDNAHSLYTHGHGLFPTERFSGTRRFFLEIRRHRVTLNQFWHCAAHHARQDCIPFCQSEQARHRDPTALSLFAADRLGIVVDLYQSHPADILSVSVNVWARG